MYIIRELEILIVFLVIFSFTSCSWFLDDHRYDYLKEEQTGSLEATEDSESKEIVDFYQIPESINPISYDSYEVPLPQQVFSSGTTNEIRLHKLGELRWLYVESLPSSVWPLMKNFWSQSQYEMLLEDPNLGLIESNLFETEGKESKLAMKIEHGIRQASSELFVSHLTRSDKGSWNRVSPDTNLEDTVLRSVMDFLSSNSVAGGTSLVALNLNLGQKATLKQKDDGSSYIEMKLEFARAWAAVDRALKEAIITVTDLDRKNGIFYVVFSQEEDKGFLRKMLSFDDNIKNENFKIYVNTEGSSCIVTVKSDNPNSSEFERDLLSQINQSLS